MASPHGHTPTSADRASSDAERSDGNKSSILDMWNSHGLDDQFSGPTDEMLVVHNTFLELCRRADLHTVAADRFTSAPAAFGISLQSPAKVEESIANSAKEVVSQSLESAPTDEALTTIMMRNIPTRTSSKTLLEVLGRTFNAPLEELVDFVYLPIDFKTNKNLGYSFMNFLDSAKAAEFIAKLNKQKYVFCDTSEKQLDISYSNRQGYFKNLEVFTQTKMLDTWPDVFRPLAKINNALTPISSDLLTQVLAGTH